MTREEAVLLVTNCTINSYDYGNLKFAVNKIYDDFENKSCDRCKYDEKDDTYPTICWECSRYYADKYK